MADETKSKYEDNPAYFGRDVCVGGVRREMWAVLLRDHSGGVRTDADLALHNFVLYRIFILVGAVRCWFLICLSANPRRIMAQGAVMGAIAIVHIILRRVSVYYHGFHYVGVLCIIYIYIHIVDRTLV